MSKTTETENKGVPLFNQGLRFMVLLRKKLGAYGFSPVYVEKNDAIVVYEIKSKWKYVISNSPGAVWGEDYRNVADRILNETIEARFGFTNPRVYKAFLDVKDD